MQNNNYQQSPPEMTAQTNMNDMEEPSAAFETTQQIGMLYGELLYDNI